MAQAQIDIQEFLLPAVTAVGEGLNLSVRWKPEELHLLAIGAQHVSILCDQFIRSDITFQYLFLRFFKTCFLFH